MNSSRLYHGAPPAASTSVFTAPAGGAVILAIVASNPTGGGQPITISIDPTGASPAVVLWGGKNVPANDFVRMPGPVHLDAGDSIVTASPSGALLLLLSGLLLA